MVRAQKGKERGDVMEVQPESLEDLHVPAVHSHLGCAESFKRNFLAWHHQTLEQTSGVWPMGRRRGSQTHLLR